MAEFMEFDKPALNLDEQIELLISRGLEVPDKERARRYLQFIGYYRLSGYAHLFQDKSQNSDEHPFLTGTTFDQVLDIYIFDRKLRFLVMDAVERIEVAVRASISNSLSVRHGPHWYMESSHFDGSYDHAGLLETVRRTIRRSNNEPFIGHYIGRYNIPELPPSWMVFEILSFGTISLIYKNLKIDARKKISKIFQLSNVDLISWLHTVSVLRNLCAHHARLTNRIFRIKPGIKKELKEYLTPNDKFNAQAVVLEHFLNVITTDSQWPSRLRTLLGEYPILSLGWLGFEENWHEKPLWRIT